MEVVDEADIQVAIHTDTINEAGFLENTLDAIGDRVIHTYHIEGAGGVSRSGYYEARLLREHSAVIYNANHSLYR